jgi:kynurenine formamidase
MEKPIDLTHTLSSDIPCWDGDCGFTLSLQTDYKDCTGPDLFRTQQIKTRGGMGTHMDAPAHCFEGQKTIDLLTLEDLITECVVVDVSDKVDELYEVTVEDIEQFEKQHGRIQEHTFVIFLQGGINTGNNQSGILIVTNFQVFTKA